MESKDPSDSRPPSPPQTRSPSPSTTRLTIAPCPARLTPLLPPINYGTVEKHTVYRSGFPHDRNVEFLEGLRLTSILTLVEEEMKSEMLNFMDMYGVRHVRVPIVANKGGEIRSTLESLCEAILYLMNPGNHPVYVHCNRGKHRTGCVIACLRKCQSWPLDEILDEYETYAGDKARPEDKQLIKAFDPADVVKYAQSQNILDAWPIKRHDSVMTCDPIISLSDLVSWLPAHKTALVNLEDNSYEDMYDVGVRSDSSDDGIEIARRVIRANHVSDIESGAVVEVEEVVGDDEEERHENERSARYDWSSVGTSPVHPSPSLEMPPVRARAAA